MDEMQIITNGEFNYRIEKARLEGVTPSFSGCEIKGVWAKYKDMERFDFSNSRLEDCDFTGANLRYSNFKGTKLRDVTFRGATLYRSNFIGADVANINDLFCFAHMSEAKIGRWDLRGVDFTRSGLHDALVDGKRCVLVSNFSTGFQINAFMFESQMYITCGCRIGMTLEEAKAHWAPCNMQDWTFKKPYWGERHLKELAALENEARLQGWFE